MECDRECSNCKTKQRTPEEHRRLVNRLSRIEGQVRGIKNMLDHDRYCIDILIQVSAIQSALNAFNRELLSEHLKSCVKAELETGNNEVIDELCQAIKRLMK